MIESRQVIVRRLGVIAVILGLATACIALLVLVGEIFHYPQLLYIHETLHSMAYFTAIGLILGGVSVVVSKMGWPRTALVLGAVIASIGLFRGAQIVFAWPPFVGLFLEKYVAIDPGTVLLPMAPNTALCFVLIGIATVMGNCCKRPWASAVGGGLCTLVIALAITALLGHLLRVEMATGWGALSHMAPLTATAMIALGLACVAMSCRQTLEMGREVRWLPIPVGFSLLVVTVLFSSAIAGDEADYRMQRVKDEHHLVSTEIQNQMQKTMDSKMPLIAMGVGLVLAVLATWVTYLIQQQRRYFRELQASSKVCTDMRDALDSSSIISTTDVRGNITSVNDNFLKISQYSRVELLGKNHRIIKSGLHPKEYYTEMWRTIAQGNVWKGEFCNRAKDGSYYWVYATIFPFLGEDGKPTSYMGIRHDITERKLLEGELQRSNRALEEFDHVVAHELKTPLTVIKMAAENMTGAKLGSLNSVQENMIGMIDRNVDQMAATINGLLRIAQSNTRGRKLDLRKMDIKRHVCEVIHALKAMAQERHVTIQDNIAEGLPSIMSSSGVFAEVLTNLINNAIRYASHEVVIGAHATPGWIQFEVCDDGMGIPKEQLSKLFEKYSSDNKAQGSLFNGTGLGLYICKDLVTHMGGEIGAKSEVSKGTCFYFTLPIAGP